MEKLDVSIEPSNPHLLPTIALWTDIFLDEFKQKVTAYFVHELRYPLHTIDSALNSMPSGLPPVVESLIESMQLCNFQFKFYGLYIAKLFCFLLLILIPLN